jgi:hypothetical protein
MPRRNLGQLTADISNKPIQKLKTDEINLFNFLALLVDIQYRVKYGCPLKEMDNRVYNKNIANEELPGRLSFVDIDPEGFSRRRISDGNR